MSTKTVDARQLKTFRSNVAKLKAAGLVSKRVDARKQKMTRHMKEQIRKYSDVLKGNAVVVKAPSAKIAKKFANEQRVKGKYIVIHNTDPEAHAFYSRKDNTIKLNSKLKSGKTRSREIYAGGAKDIKGENILYTIPIGGSVQRFDTWEELERFMRRYDIDTVQAGNNVYRDWEKYVQITRII